MSVNTVIKSLIQRILSLKDEQDERGSDIREIYAEAKATGLDKTALGQAVSIIRKRAKDPDKFREVSSSVELYLDAYDGTGTANATRARAGEGEGAGAGNVINMDNHHGRTPD